MECIRPARCFVVAAALSMLAACNATEGFYGQALPEASAMPIIRTQPQTRAAVAGSPVKFIVEVTAPGAVTYQWRRNGIALPGETEAVLVVPAAAGDDHAQYAVVVGNALATVTSQPAELRVSAARAPARVVSDRAAAP
jgi:hypothetical protein